MATKTTFQDMLKQVVKSPNESRSRKFLKLVKAGMTEAEANNVLDQVSLFEKDGADAPADIFMDSKNAKQTPVDKMRSYAPKMPKGGSNSKLLKKLKL
jgi:hypothetical protein